MWRPRTIVFELDRETRGRLGEVVAELRAIRGVLAAERVTPEMETRVQALIARVNKIDPDKTKKGR